MTEPAVLVLEHGRRASKATRRELSSEHTTLSRATWVQLGATVVIIQLKTVHHDSQPQRHRIGRTAKPLEPERRLRTPALLHNEPVDDLRPRRLQAIHPTTDRVEQILLRCL